MERLWHKPGFFLWHNCYMHVILTHEQADFDALASLLGAFLLYDGAVPILPRRMNRNVRAFVALYGAELPFVDPRDLPNGPIEKITIVDTQAMVSLRGTTAETRVNVIDHHPRRVGLPEEWEVAVEGTGATSTLLVEALHEHNGPLLPVHATLMLLGIYEDTGSLTYSRTTSRDLKAAAHLIDNGASLSIASDFLNHPLSASQQELYERLRSSIENFDIHGYSILIACGNALEMDEELSTLAHRLRDLLDPDALFLLVDTRAGVQFIARSTTDHIDVSAVARHFGGGGHERAAASLIKGKESREVREELLRLLPEYVQPALTVSQIMSRGVQILAPDETLHEAARKMRLFGYEGYPVVSDGKVVGLLTRRAVDRALSHNLDYPVSRLMEKGEISIKPGDSIDLLQRLVTESGWGQIPVVDDNDSKVIGIVTRTDLLKNLTSRLKPAGPMNLASKLDSALPADRLALLKTIALAATELRMPLFVVGGFVRDLLLDRPSLDFDLVVEGDAITLARMLSKKYGGRVTGHARFGTAKWHLDPGGSGSETSILEIEGLQTLDLVSARTEFYTHPTALPTIERGSIKLDLHRRDFTINTLALRLDGRHYGELHDHWGGLNDLRLGLVRVLHSLSFVDDPTRILRAVRFEQRLNFQIEERTMELLLAARPLIARLSGDRIRHELNYILESSCAGKILNRFLMLELIEAIHPEMIWNVEIKNLFESLNDHQPEDSWGIHETGKVLRRDLEYIIWLMQHSLEAAERIAVRLKLPVYLKTSINSAAQLWNNRDRLTQMKTSQFVKELEDKPSLAIYGLYLSSQNNLLRQKIKAYQSNWRFVSATIDGNQLRKLGIPTGPCYKEILGALRDAWLDGLISDTRAEKTLLDQLIQEKGL